MLDGVDKNAHILHHQLALGFWARGKHALYQSLCLLHSIAALCRRFQRFRAKLFCGQAQHGAGMALGEVLRHAKLLLGRGKRQKPQLVGQCGLGNAKPPGPGLLCATPKV